MNELPIRRRAPGFVAMRWRHLFWLLPLAGLFIGLETYFGRVFPHTASGVVQFDPGSLYATSHSKADLIAAFSSDTTLDATTTNLGLVRRWKRPLVDCNAKLRSIISVEDVAGTLMFRVRVTGRNRKEAIEVWRHVFKESNRRFTDAWEAKRKSTALKVESLKIETERARKSLSSLIISAGGKTYDFSPPAGDSRRPEFDRLRSDFESKLRESQNAIVELINQEKSHMIFTPVAVVHLDPASRPVGNFWDRFGLCIMHACCGAGVGFLLSVSLAYLLQFLVPRRTPGPATEV